MTTKTQLSLITVMAITAILLIPATGLATASTPVELSDEIKQKISKMPTERQPHMEKIFKLLIEKEQSGNESDKERIDGLIQAEYAKMSTSEEQARPQYLDHPQLRAIQSEIRELEDLPLVTTLVGKNKLTILLSPGNENKGYEDIIDQYIPNKNLNVVIEYGEITSKEWACTSQEDDCDPLYGGLAIREGGSGSSYCTLGLPVKQGSTIGYLTAGHCYAVNDEVHQPYDHWLWNWKIGDTDESHNDNDCDCAFIEDTNSRTNESKVWFSSGYQRTISGNQVATDGEELDISGNTGGWYWEDVYDNNWYHPSHGTRLLLEDSGSGGPGDSGGPVIDLSDGDIVGIVEGEVTIGSTTYIKIVLWSQVADSTNGVGVSLL